MNFHWKLSIATYLLDFVQLGHHKNLTLSAIIRIVVIELNRSSVAVQGLETN